MTDWFKIEALMLKSFTGGTLTEGEQRTVQAAYEAEPKEYGERHQRVVREEIERRQKEFA
jgi:hypothetical protein